MKNLARLLFSCLLLLWAQPGISETTETTYYIPDASGSPIAAMDEAGNIKWRKHYRPFGEEIEQDAASKDNRIGYTGHVHDRSTGLTYMGARYYDPAIGRFMSMDPAAVNPNDPASFNRFAYANNNPYRYVDPDGRTPIEAMFPYLAVQNTAATLGVDPGTRSGADAVSRQWQSEALDQASAVTTMAPGLAALKLTKVTKTPKGPLWASTKSKSAVENAFGHWKKHKGEFPEFQNAKQYAEGTKKFLNGPPKGTLTKTRSNGDTLLYDPKTNTFGVKDVSGTPRTMFRPKDGMDYWNKQ